MYNKIKSLEDTNTIVICNSSNVSNYKKAIPYGYTEEEISKTLATVDRSSAIGKRDYLILLLAAEYGWRTGDIVNFKFSQIDWDNNTITFEQHKTDIPVEFPLLSSVGNAIIDYLQHGRPKSDAPEIIVSAENGKNGTPLKPSTVHSIVSRYLREADIPPRWLPRAHRRTCRGSGSPVSCMTSRRRVSPRRCL